MMTALPNPKNAVELVYRLHQSRDAHHQRVDGQPLTPPMILLRSWQSARLARTQADLLQTDQYAAACNFFLTDLYAPKDFSQRDHDIERIHQFMRNFMPDRVIYPLTATIALYYYSQELDEALLTILVNDLKMTNTLSSEMYAEAYRICNNYQDRKTQIEMVTEVGHRIDRLVHIPLVATTLRLARRPARKAGWHEMQDFLERGFQAFKKMGEAEEFLHIVESRETTILDNIFAGHPDPFGFGESLVVKQSPS